MILRDYQAKGVTDVSMKLAAGKKRIVFQLPTGGGKTVIFSAMSHRYAAKNAGKSALILVHRKELLAQTRKTLHRAYGVSAQQIIAGMKFIPPAEVYVGMVETVHKRIAKMLNIGLLIVDECHRLEFIKVVDALADSLVVGVTATPMTASKKRPLKLFYDDIVCGPQIERLIEDKHLCQNITYAPKEIVDRQELMIKNGEFDDVKMELEFSKPKYIHNTITAYEKWSKNTKTIVFNVSMKHNRDVCEAFVAAGYPARVLDSSMSKIQREEVINWFTMTTNAILCNVGIATTGFDEPTIETVIVNKATMSMPLWLQMTGRGSRPTLAKSMFTIIDMGGNALTHGDWCANRNWEDLFFNPPKPGKKEGVAPVKSCPNCDAIIAAGAQQCKFCEFIFPEKMAQLEEELGEFVVVTEGIDVHTIMDQHKHKKEYYPFFKIGTDLAAEAKKTIPVMTDDYVTFILSVYAKLAKTWCKEMSDRRIEEWESTPIPYDKPKRVGYNRWHKEKAREHLINELKKHYPKWQPATEQNYSASTPA